jgi:hypothetical protein
MTRASDSQPLPGLSPDVAPAAPPPPPPKLRAFSAAIFSRRGASTLLLIIGFLVIATALVSGGLTAQTRRTASQGLYSAAEVGARPRDDVDARDFETANAASADARSGLSRPIPRQSSD